MSAPPFMDNWNALAETALRPASQSPQLMTLVFVFVFVLKCILHLVPSKIHTSKYLYHQWPTPEPLCSTYSHHDINITQTKLGVKRDFGLLQFFSFCLDKKSVFVKIAISMTRPHLHLWHQKSHIFDNLLMRNIVE